MQLHNVIVAIKYTIVLETLKMILPRAGVSQPGAHSPPQGGARGLGAGGGESNTTALRYLRGTEGTHQFFNHKQGQRRGKVLY